MYIFLILALLGYGIDWQERDKRATGKRARARDREMRIAFARGRAR